MFLRTASAGHSWLSFLVRTGLQDVFVASSRPATSKATEIACWKCGAVKPLDNFFCNKCSSLQEPNTTSSYFDVLGVDRKFDLKAAELTKKFRQLQGLLHPDKFSTKSEHELAHSENHSAILNQAYSTLLKPLDRGLYLLKLHGMSIKEGTIQMDPTFLMEIMELNEKLEEADSRESVLKLSEENSEVISQYTKDIDEAFHKKDLDKAKELLTKLKYYCSLEDKIKELKSKNGIVL